MTRGKKYQGWLLVAALFLLCTLVYGLLSSYPRELAVYSDEVRYLDIARSLCRAAACGCATCPVITRRSFTPCASCPPFF